MVVVNKPSGLLVHRSFIDRHETRFALQEVRNAIGRHVYPVHRLDKPTSGVLLFALSSECAKRLSHMFLSREVRKSYIAVVRGYVDREGVVDHPLKQMLDTKLQKRMGKSEESYEARTYYRRLGTVEVPFAVGRYDTARYSLVALMPETGRKHQLRRHMKHISHHMIGDTKHGRGEHNRFFREYLGVRRLLLHAYELSLTHPETGRKLTFCAPLDEDFAKVLRTFGWNGVELEIENYR